MLRRSKDTVVKNALNRQAAVALLGPRQVGKMTLTHLIGDERPSIYFDLEKPSDRDRLNSKKESSDLRDRRRQQP